MSRKDDCRDALLVAVAKSLEMLLEDRRNEIARRHGTPNYGAATIVSHLAEAQGELTACRELFEKA